MEWNGTLQKATIDAQGVPHLVYWATGPQVDRQTERMSKLALDKFEAGMKAGKAFLVPGHDVVLPLAKSVDAPRDPAGELLVDFAVDRDDPVAMKTFRMIESGEWKPQVSIGAEHVTRQKTFDAALGKTITEITDIDIDRGIHVALCFPGRAVYPSAGLVQALTKATKADAHVGESIRAELAKRHLPEGVIQKATGPNGEYIPPTFAERHMQNELAEEMPGMLDTLRWTIEDILSPWSAGDKPALLAQTFKEFAAAVGQEIDEAGGFAASIAANLAKADKAPYGEVKYADPGYQEDKVKRYPIDTEKHIRAAWSYINKAGNADKYSSDQVDKIKGKIVAAWKKVIDKEGPPAAKAEDPELAKYDPLTGEGDFLAKAIPPASPDKTEPETPALKAVAALADVVTKGFAEVKGAFEALHKAKTADDSAQKATPTPAPAVPVVPDTDPASAPDTGCKVDSAVDTQANARKTTEDKVEELRKAIAAERNPGRRGHLQQQHAGLLAKLSRMP